MKKNLAIAVCALLALAACSSNPPPPQWPADAKGSSERAADAWLSNCPP